MRAEAGVPLGRARFTELSLLVWVAAFAVTGFVAVLATETSSFSPTAAVVPAVFLTLMLALHVFLVGIRFRGDQILMPIAAGLTAIGLILVQRLASDLLLQQLSWSIIAAGAFAATILVPRDLTALARFKWTWAILGVIPPVLFITGAVMWWNRVLSRTFSRRDSWHEQPAGRIRGPGWPRASGLHHPFWHG